MLELRFLTKNDESTFRAAVAEFKIHNPGWEFAFNFSDSTNFEEYCELLRNRSEGQDLEEN